MNTLDLVLILLTQGIGLATGIIGYRATRRTIRGATAAIGEVHTLVNSRSDRQDSRIDQLTTKLTAAGVAVPAKPNGATQAGEP